ncbi:hypothetical protein ACQ4LE_009654 [Meloidogyne hapla]|uniref:Uncharacterized protein n=1 Tax=Meloidogyne hapla TaxID=6305 RepID=A0A1I8BE72_MELHA
MFIFILQNYLNNGNSNKFIGGTRFILWLMAASFLFVLIIAVKHSDAKPLVSNNFYNFAEQSLDKRESTKMLHRRELNGLKRLIDEIVRSGYDGGAAFRPGK